jgi:hypothetical protein
VIDEQLDAMRGFCLLRECSRHKYFGERRVDPLLFPIRDDDPVNGAAVAFGADFKFF